MAHTPRHDPTSICTWAALLGINGLLITIITIIMIENQRGWRELVIDDKIKYMIYMHENFKE